MKYVFVDTNAWIALNYKRDQWHETAMKVNKTLLEQNHRYITTNNIFVYRLHIMKQMYITKAFTNDHHFEQMGYQILLV